MTQSKGFAIDIYTCIFYILYISTISQTLYILKQTHFSWEHETVSTKIIDVISIFLQARLTTYAYYYKHIYFCAYICNVY